MTSPRTRAAPLGYGAGSAWVPASPRGAAVAWSSADRGAAGMGDPATAGDGSEAARRRRPRWTAAALVAGAVLALGLGEARGEHEARGDKPASQSFAWDIHCSAVKPSAEPARVTTVLSF